MRKIIQAYVLVGILFSVFFLFLFRTPLFANQRVLFYRGNLLLAVTVIVILAFSGFIRKILKVNFETVLAALVMSASIHLSVFVVFPVTFDRSVTMYLLNRLNTYETPECHGMTEKEMESIFIKEYVKGQQAMRRRITEQSVIDMVRENNRCVQLTDRGTDFLRFSETVKKLYNLN